MAANDQAGEVIRKAAVSDGSGGYRLQVEATTAASGSDSATVTYVAASDSAITLLSANTSRKGFKLYNDSTVSAYVKFGTAAASNSFTLKMAPESFWEPEDATPYRGIITAVWESATGSMAVTEMTT